MKVSKLDNTYVKFLTLEAAWHTYILQCLNLGLWMQSLTWETCA